MKYRSTRDPLFLFCLALYFVNRWVLIPTTSIEFLRSHLNDLICIPFWVPILIAFMRVVGFRGDDGPPRSYEILIPLIVWSFVFEILLPRVQPFQPLAIPDPLDIFFYALGGLLSACFWKWWYAPRCSTATAAST